MPKYVPGTQLTPSSYVLEVHHLPSNSQEAPVDGYYKVEKILGRRVKQKKGKKYAEFHVKWLGFDYSENSWEPQKNITPDLVNLYNRNNPQALCKEVKELQKLCKILKRKSAAIAVVDAL
ncbi:hypothetical protein CEUSTIGMA_g14043.t1 [Chlamydomonas eustigma]|uniref:Chromo domain-containing protein n=1 Tax=Chlamydomonas eustigma TaxID=1157962 RepID=A0A250XU85_9CHLO|nr:hypothetical protein CEUSTIGMA_g14043.t1 [Chlamydomonas eustigma]|eukprot:GAX86635.1 hypothetical protein CEUSTIGMA_g14043.t1 [Chlamydomonas eustigma]